MNISIWKILSFIVFVTVVTVLIFPDKRKMALYYKKAGMPEQSLTMVTELLEDKPQDVDLLVVQSELFHLVGEPDKAIAALEIAYKIDPDDINVIKKLVRFYELNRLPSKTLQFLEKVVVHDPYDKEAWAKLIDLYRYYMLYEKESRSIKRLVKLEYEKPDDVENETVKTRLIKSNPLVKELDVMLKQFLNDKDFDNDLLLNDLITGLYVVRKNYMLEIGYSLERNYPNLGEGVNLYESIGKPNLENENRLENYQVDQEGAITRCLELFIRIGNVEKGVLFAEKLDKTLEANIKNSKRLVQVLRWNGMGKEAIDVLKDLSAKYPADYSILELLADVSLEYGDIKVVVETYEALLKDSINVENYSKNLANIYLGIEKPDKAYELYKKLVKAGKEDSVYLNKMIDTARFTGDKQIMKEAIEITDKANSNSVDVLLKIAEMSLAVGDSEKAIDYYERLKDMQPDDQNISRLLAQSYVWSNQPQKAFEVIKNAVVGKAENKSALLELAKYAEAAGFNDEAYVILEKLYKQEPTDSSIQNDLVRLGLWTNRAKEVALILGEISEQSPGNIDMALKAGKALVETDNIEMGIKFFERAISLNHKGVDLRRKLAKYYGWLGHNDKMITQLKYLNSLGLLNEDELTVLAQAYLDKGDGQNALSCLETRINSGKLSARDGIMVATAYELMRKYDSAAFIYKRLAKDNDRNSTLLAEIGRRALWINRSDIALEFFNSTLKIDRKNLIALKGSGQIYAQQNDFVKAMRVYKRYNRLYPGDYETHFLLGELFFSNGNKHAAHSEYLTALKLIKNKNVVKWNQK